jgi:hypothetical protein
MPYLVLRRTNQIGVRMAPGARDQDIRAMVLREAGTLLAVVSRSAPPSRWHRPDQ